MPDQMTPAQRAAYRRIFTLIRGNQFAAAAAALNTMPSNGLLTGTDWAELWLSAGSPGASAGALSGWLSTNIALPQVERITAPAHRQGEVGSAECGALGGLYGDISVVAGALKQKNML